MRSLRECINESLNNKIVKVPSVYKNLPDESWKFLDTSYIIKDSDIKDSDFEKHESGQYSSEKEITYNLKFNIPYDPSKSDLIGWHTIYKGLRAFTPVIGQDYRTNRFFIFPADNSGSFGSFSTFGDAKKALIKHINEYRQIKSKQNKK